MSSISQYSNIFNEVKRIPAVEIARRYLPGLRRQGSRWVARCPFHEDGTPSFFVFENRFHCFGCGWGGDSVDFVARLYGLRPIEAAREIAGAFGLAGGNVFSLRRDALPEYRRERQEATEKKREKAKEERIISDFQILFRAAGRLVAQIRTLEDLDRYGWIYQHLGNLEEVAAALFSADRGTRQAALASARRWLP